MHTRMISANNEPPKRRKSTDVVVRIRDYGRTTSGQAVLFGPGCSVTKRSALMKWCSMEKKGPYNVSNRIDSRWEMASRYNKGDWVSRPCYFSQIPNYCEVLHFDRHTRMRDEDIEMHFMCWLAEKNMNVM
ncbi:hypothetical protein QTP88_002549 [Uroleucon formosanum]